MNQQSTSPTPRTTRKPRATSTTATVRRKPVTSRPVNFFQPPLNVYTTTTPKPRPALKRTAATRARRRPITSAPFQPSTTRITSSKTGFRTPQGPSAPLSRYEPSLSTYKNLTCVAVKTFTSIHTVYFFLVMKITR